MGGIMALNALRAVWTLVLATVAGAIPHLARQKWGRLTGPWLTLGQAWMCAVLVLIVAFAPWVSLKMSVRELLISTALFAITLGAIVYATHIIS
jgi:hypothetical protein